MNKERGAVPQTVDRSLRMLVLLTKSELGPTELSRALGLHRTTVHRLLRALVYRGFVQSSGVGGRYRANLTYLFELAGGLTTNGEQNWLLAAKPYLVHLRAQTGLSVSLCMPSGKEMVYVVQILGREGLTVHSPPGTRRYMHTSAVGKAYLSALPDHELDAFLPGLELIPLTPRTITSRAKFREHLRKSRVNGYSVDDGEFDLHIRCVAAPIRDAFGRPLGSIGVSGVTTDPVFKRMRSLGAEIVQSAGAVSRILGYDARKLGTGGRVAALGTKVAESLMRRQPRQVVRIQWDGLRD